MYDLFVTADKEQVFIGVTSDRHWKRLCEAFGYDDWVHNEMLATNQARIQEREWFLPELARRLGRLSKTELMELAARAGIPFAAVNEPIDLMDDRQMNESGSLVEVITPSGKVAKLPKIPLRLAGKSFGLRMQPPSIGEGSRIVYQRIGLSDTEIASLQEQGVIQLS